jgi:hypothetical protein
VVEDTDLHDFCSAGASGRCSFSGAQRGDLTCFIVVTAAFRAIAVIAAFSLQ